MGILSFKSKVSEQIWKGEVSKSSLRELPLTLHENARTKLSILNTSSTLNELRQFKSLNLEVLKGNLLGYYSIRINKQYRICFKFKDKNVFDVFATDYH